MAGWYILDRTNVHEVYLRENKCPGGKFEGEKYMGGKFEVGEMSGGIFEGDQMPGR